MKSLIALLLAVCSLLLVACDSGTENTDPSSPRLTDGKLSPTVENCYNEYWFYTPGGGAIDFFYDIGYLSSVETLTISLLEYKDWGIARPEDVSVFLSDDGKTWYRVAMETRNNDEINKKGTRINYEYKLDKAYAARFVRFRMEGAMMLIDEFEAIGTKKVTNKTAPCRQRIPHLDLPHEPRKRGICNA